VIATTNDTITAKHAKFGIKTDSNINANLILNFFDKSTITKMETAGNFEVIPDKFYVDKNLYLTPYFINHTVAETFFTNSLQVQFVAKLLFYLCSSTSW
jgi:hypothetical protein